MLEIAQNSLNEVIYRFGIASLCQMVMVPKSGRIGKSAIQVALRMIQTFTMSYPTCNRREAPKLFIVFTNFSKFDKLDDDSDSDFSLSDAEAEEE